MARKKTAKEQTAKWTIHPGHETFVYIGNIPDGQGGLAGIYKAYKDFTQEELKRLKAWSPGNPHIIGPVVVLGAPRDNKPSEAIPEPPKEKDGGDSDETKG